LTRPLLFLTILLTHAPGVHPLPKAPQRVSYEAPRPSIVMGLLRLHAPPLPVLKGWAQSFEPIVYRWADANLVPRWLAMKILHVESDANPWATGNEWVRKRVHGKWKWVRGKVLAEGAFMIATKPEDRLDHVNRAGMNLADFDPWDAEDSARVGLCFMGSLLVYFRGELRPSVSGYNAGRGTARAWWEGRRALPAETVGYLSKVLGA